VKAPVRQGPLGFVTAAFTRDVPLKLVALVLSIVLFSIVHADQDAQRTVQIDVVALVPDVSAKQMLVSELPPQVSVTLRGSRSRINDLSSDDIPPIQMDLTDPGQQYYYFEPSAVELSGNVQVIGIEPASVPLTWAVSAERRVPIRARLRGDVREGLSVRQPVQVEPGTVTIRGPQPAVEGIVEVHTDAILLDGLGPGSHQPRVPLELLPDKVVYVDTHAVQARITIEPESAEQAFRHLEIATVGGGAASMRPAHVSVTLRGVKAQLVALDPEQLVPYVELDAAQLADGTTPREVQLRGVPEGLQVVRISPRTVLVKARRGEPRETTP
jgi:YbbR domain-containing protein